MTATTGLMMQERLEETRRNKQYDKDDEDDKELDDTFRYLVHQYNFDYIRWGVSDAMRRLRS